MSVVNPMRMSTKQRATKKVSFVLAAVVLHAVSKDKTIAVAAWRVPQ